MGGYHNNEPANRKAFPLGLETGWLDTGEVRPLQ